MRRDKAYQTELDDDWICLLVFDHPDLPLPLRFTDAGQNITSNSQLYIYLPIAVQLPDQIEGQAPVGRIVVDNVSQIMTAALRSIETPLTVSISVVLMSAPDSIEQGPYDFEIKGVTFDKLSIQADLIFEPTFGVMVPTDIYSPPFFPGLKR